MPFAEDNISLPDILKHECHEGKAHETETNFGSLGVSVDGTPENRAIIGQEIGQSGAGLGQPIPGCASGAFDGQQPMHCQFAQVVAGRPFGDQEQFSIFTVADAASTATQGFEQPDLARVERNLFGLRFGAI